MSHQGATLRSVAAAMCDKTGKRQLTRREAMAEATWWRRVKMARMKHYRCDACGSWHVGNDRRKGPRGKGRRR